jgi:Ice-binding-like/Protein of unknown function (DUF2793)
MSIVPGVKITSLMASAANGDTYGDAERKIFRGIQTLVMPNVISVFGNTPPVSPVNGQTYIVGTAPTGVWAGQANAVAYWANDPQDGVVSTPQWEFYTPQAGWTFYNQATGTALTWNGTSWAPPIVVPNVTPVTPSAGAFTINAALGNNFVVALAPGVNTMTISNPTNGQTINILYQQNGGGGTVSFPSYVHSLGFVGGAGTLSAVDLELLTADQYVVLGGSGVSSAATTTISGGNVGSYPTNSITGTFTYTAPAAQVTAIAQNQTDLSAAITYYAGLTPTQTVTTADLGTQSGGGAPTGHYYPGVYNSGSTIAINTPITLDAQGNANALFVFQAGSATTQQSAGTMNLINGAQASNVVWVCGSAFTESGASGVTVGDILAQTSITLGGGTLVGRALAATGSVTISAAMAISVPAATPAGAFHAQPSPANNSTSSQTLTYNLATNVWYQTALGTYGL